MSYKNRKDVIISGNSAQIYEQISGKRRGEPQLLASPA